MLADELDYVVGVDTHRDEHVLAVVTAPAGAVTAQTAVAANSRGYCEALRFVERYAPTARAWAIEGTGSCGAGLARDLARHGERVLELSRMPRSDRRLRGKDDALDAVATARAALAGETLAAPRSGERREALRLLLVARRSAVDVRREALVQLRAVIVTAPDHLRNELRTLPTGRLLKRCRLLRRSTRSRPDELATRLVLRSLAHRIEAATSEADQLEQEILTHVRALAPQLLDEPGVGPIVAAQLIVAWSHQGRVRSEACFRPPRRHRTDPRLQRPDHPGPTQPRRRPPTQPRTAYRHPPPPPARPGDQGPHRAPCLGREKPPRRHPTAQALPRPPPLPTTRTTATADDLTGHRSITPEQWPKRPSSAP